MSNSRIPSPSFSFRHHYPVQLRILDIDAMGHVNNAIYFQLMDLAKMHYFTALGGVVRRQGGEPGDSECEL